MSAQFFHSLMYAWSCSVGCTEVGMEGEVAVYNPNTRQRRTFKYDRVFGPESSQAEVYEDTKALIRSVLDGG